jgi:hypothetical protein
VADEWYLTDVPRLVSETGLLYRRIVEKAPEKTCEAVTVQRTVEERNWGETVGQLSLGEAVRRLGYFYVPKVMAPGPAFVFPIRNPDGTFPRAQTKPLKGSPLFREDAKYRYVGDRDRLIGPPWLGNDPATLREAIGKQAVLCVEGPFDLVALRALCPSYPIMSPLTKRLGKQHVAYLRMLGVIRLILMYDNDPQGEESMGQQERQIKDMQVIPCTCPTHDPSKALEAYQWARTLASTVSQLFGY